MRTASEVSGEDLGGFLHDWLYGMRTPPVPGHPDWTVAPAGDAPGAAAEGGDTGATGATGAAAVVGAAGPGTAGAAVREGGTGVAGGAGVARGPETP